MTPTWPPTLPNPPVATDKRRFLEHYGSTVLSQALSLGLGILTGALSARILGPVGRGEYTAIIIWPMGIGMLCWVGLSQAIVFTVGRKIFTISEIATATLVIGMIQSAASVILGLLIVPHALANYSPTVRHLGILFVLLTPTLILCVYPSNLFQGLQNMMRFNLIRLMPPSIYAGGLLWLYFAHRGSLSSVIFWQVSGYVVAIALGVAMVWRILRPRLQWNKEAIPRLLHFGFRSQSTNLSSYFNQRVDQLMLSLFVPPQQLGFYAVAVTLSTAVTVFPQAVGIVTLSRGSGQNREDALATIGRSFRASIAWLLVCCGVLYILTPFLIRLFFGAAFEGSILACRILLPGALMLGLNQVLYNGASALGRPGLPSIAEGVSMAVTAVGLYLLVPHHGYIGAAIVSTAAYTVSFLLMIGLMRHLLGLGLTDLFVGR